MTHSLLGKGAFINEVLYAKPKKQAGRRAVGACSRLELSGTERLKSRIQHKRT